MKVAIYKLISTMGTLGVQKRKDVCCSGKSNEKSANEFSCKLQKCAVSFLCFQLLMQISKIYDKKTSKHNGTTKKVLFSV